MCIRDRFKDGLFTPNDSHTFKFGGSYENASVAYNSTPNGGATLYDDSSACPGEGDAQFAYYMAHPECGLNEYAYRETGYGEYHEWLQTTSIDLYAQDSMRLNRWTLNYGVRYGHYKGGFQPGTGNTDVYNVSFADPRVGFVWDVFGDSKTALKAHWGRYHQKMMGYLYDREVSGHIAARHRLLLEFGHRQVRPRFQRRPGLRDVLGPGCRHDGQVCPAVRGRVAGHHRATDRQGHGARPRPDRPAFPRHHGDDQHEPGLHSEDRHQQPVDGRDAADLGPQLAAELRPHHRQRRLPQLPVGRHALREAPLPGLVPHTLARLDGPQGEPVSY